MRCAVVDVINNVIVNTIVADPERDTPPDGMMLAWVPDFVNLGDPWNNGVFVEPIKPGMGSTPTSPSNGVTLL